MTDLNKNTPLPQCVQTDVKSRFFAQYWGTKTLYIGGVGLVELGKGGWNLKHPDFFLQLKPLSKITDEDALNVKELVKETFYFDKIYDSKQINRAVIRMITEYTGSWLHVGNCMFAIDYLRGKGYALPFMEYSVDELVSFGWVKLL